jgi:hypothetical protein
MSDEHRVQIDFGAVAEPKKSPSIAGQRHADTKFPSPYTLMQDTLFECLRELMSKPISQQHLYEIHTLRKGSSGCAHSRVADPKKFAFERAMRTKISALRARP